MPPAPRPGPLLAFLCVAAAPSHAHPPPPPQLAVTVFPRQTWALLRVSTLTPYSTLACDIVPAAGGPAIWSRAMPAPGAVSQLLEVEARPSQPPNQWDTASPALYSLTCGDGHQPNVTVRFGFRDFAARDGQFLLNGRPIFVRGWSINPPGRSLPAAAANKSFALDYLRWMRDKAGVNAHRIGDGASSSNQHWYDASDELGLLIFSGPYGGVQCPGCSSGLSLEARLNASVGRYQSVLMETASHPSHVILILSNEVGLDDTPSWHSGKNADTAFLRNVSRALARWDGSRAYLGDAGFGLGRGGEVNDDHTYLLPSSDESSDISETTEFYHMRWNISELHRLESNCPR